MRCQLLTGSYADATRSCPCKEPRDCHFTSEQREALRRDARVAAARERNLEEFVTKGRTRAAEPEEES